VNESLRQKAVQIAFLAVVGIGWQFAVNRHAVNPLILPSLGAIGSRFVTIFADGTVWPAVGVTLGEFFAAFITAVVSGTVIGYAISRSAFSVTVFDPLLAALYAVPTILLYPLYVLLFGIGVGSKIAFGITIAFFPVVLSTIAGLSNVASSLLLAARSMGASDWQLFADVLLPASFPMILAGLRVGLVLAFLSILGAETIAASAGVGHQISQNAERFDTADMFAWVFVAILLAFGMNGIASFIESRARRASN
jgi:ABC-type nitrate/sulfonate/bicarbonate transport system permease component